MNFWMFRSNIRDLEYYHEYSDLKTFEKLSSIIEDDINNIFDVDFTEHFSNFDVNEKCEN